MRRSLVDQFDVQLLVADAADRAGGRIEARCGRSGSPARWSAADLVRLAPCRREPRRGSGQRRAQRLNVLYPSEGTSAATKTMLPSGKRLTGTSLPPAASHQPETRRSLRRRHAHHIGPARAKGLKTMMVSVRPVVIIARQLCPGRCRRHGRMNSLDSTTISRFSSSSVSYCRIRSRFGLMTSMASVCSWYGASDGRPGRCRSRDSRRPPASWRWWRTSRRWGWPRPAAAPAPSSQASVASWSAHWLLLSLAKVLIFAGSAWRAIVLEEHVHRGTDQARIGVAGVPARGSSRRCPCVTSWKSVPSWHSSVS